MSLLEKLSNVAEVKHSILDGPFRCCLDLIRVALIFHRWSFNCHFERKISNVINMACRSTAAAYSTHVGENRACALVCGKRETLVV